MTTPIGDFARPGRTYRPKGKPITAPDHDFIGRDTPVAIPYGIYDLGRDKLGPGLYAATAWSPASLA